MNLIKRSFFLLGTQAIVITEVTPIRELSLEKIPALHLMAFQNTLSYESTYSLTTNGKNQKIFGSLMGPLPPDTTLSVCLQAPQGAISMGTVVLSAEPQVLVFQITQTAQENLSITYTLDTTKLALEGTYLPAVTFSLSE